LGSAQGETVKSKLRSAGTDALRYLLDHPLVFITGFADTGPAATGVAAVVWGRDEDGGGGGGGGAGGGFVFKQKDIDALVQQADPRGPLYAAATAGSLILTVAPRSSRAILHLCVSVSAPARA